MRRDVVVVGLGPAGAFAAAAAARAGARVIAIERRCRPGLPVQCAELVPQGIALELGALEMVTRQSIQCLTTSIEEDAPIDSIGFCGHMIDRAAFDRAAVEAAIAAGAECRFGIACRGIDALGRVELSDGSVLVGAVVIAADGPRSVIGRALGLINASLIETRQICVPLATPSEASDVFLMRRLRGGYGWLFPSRDRANLGVGAERGTARTLKEELGRLRCRLLRAGRIGETVLSMTGGAIPSGGIAGLIGRIDEVPILLVGDAAGLANPVTGAGIAAAIISGRLAGMAAAAVASGCAAAARDYVEEIEDLFGPSLRRAIARADVRRAAPSGAADWRRSWIAFPEYWQG